MDPHVTNMRMHHQRHRAATREHEADETLYPRSQSALSSGPQVEKFRDLLPIVVLITPPQHRPSFCFFPITSIPNITLRTKNPKTRLTRINRFDLWTLPGIAQPYVASTSLSRR